MSIKSGQGQWRREEISASKQKNVKGGARQAEIEASCIARVLRWLRLNKGLLNVPSISVEDLKATLRAIQIPARPRFTDEEVAKIEKVIDKADPRLAMMLSIQAAQRAGQLRRAQRSGLTITRDSSGNVESVALLVPSSRKNKPAGRYYLTPEGAFYLMQALQCGYLRELEAEYQATGVDYPIFVGSRLKKGQVAPRGQLRPVDRRTMLAWFVELEATAGVRHVEQRGFHGFRRRAVDTLLKAGATPAQIQAAGNWSSIQIPMEIYREGITDQDRRQAAALLANTASATKAVAATAAPESALVEVSYPETDPDLAQALTQNGLTNEEVDEAMELTKWAWVELNYRPHAYQACALTT